MDSSTFPPGMNVCVHGTCDGLVTHSGYIPASCPAFPGCAPDSLQLDQAKAVT